MTREEIVKTLIEPVYTVQEKRWNDQNYAYWETLSRWETPEQALANIPKPLGSVKHRILKQSLDVTNEGRVAFYGSIVVLSEDKVWHEQYDPRKSDPEWKTYLRLKEKFDE